MGGINSILKKFSCNCASDCHINDEVKELKKFVKRLAEDDLREIKEYFDTKRELLEKEKRRLRAELLESVQRNIVMI